MPRYIFGSWQDTSSIASKHRLTHSDHRSSRIMSESIAPQPSESFPSISSASSIPDAASLYGITRRHGRESILVPPLLWTNRHLELLQISFDDPSPAPTINRTDCYRRRDVTAFEQKIIALEKKRMKYHLRRFHLFKSRQEYFCNMLCGRGSPFTTDWFAFFPFSIFII
jgi:hypothetical protein